MMDREIYDGQMAQERAGKRNLKAVKPGTCGACEHGPTGGKACPMGREHVTQDSKFCAPMAALTAARTEVERLRTESERWTRAYEVFTRETTDEQTPIIEAVMHLHDAMEVG